jgi:alcohol dehydrogenase class IV
MISIWSFPTRVVFGPGARAKLGEEAARLGLRRPLVVTDAGVRAAGVLGEALGTAGGSWPVFDGVSANPLGAEVHAGAAAYRAGGCDGVVAVGGGAPMDVGKLVRLAVTDDRPLHVFDDAIGGGDLVRGPLPPLVCMPTTSGTGSEVGRSGVVTLPETGRKTVIFAPPLLAAVAICDPELTLGLPPRPTAATGMDALTHGIESYLSVGHHPMADAIALECVRLVARSLRRAVSDGRDVAARSDMMAAAAMGAVAFQKGLGVCHALAHPLSSVAGLHHGLANALMLPHALRFNASSVPERMAEVARALGGTDAAAAVEALRAHVGLPDRLSACGVTAAMLDALADGAANDGCLAGNPRPASREDLRALYVGAM